MTELVEAANLAPGDVIMNMTLEWTVTAVEHTRSNPGIVAVTATSGPAWRHFTSMAEATYSVVRRGKMILQAKRDLVAAMGDFVPV